jgi:glycosyltransferase involved in cell wall biosynthesis
VPALADGGGVPAVAKFIKDVVDRDGRYDLTVVSLSTASGDNCNLGLAMPGTWLRGVTTSSGQWQGVPFVHVGALFGEFEFQRYKPRRVLAEAVAGCDILQVVCGSPAWALAVCGLGKPVAIQCATRARIERRARDAFGRGFKSMWRKGMTEVTDRFEMRALRDADAVQVENQWMFDYTKGLQNGRSVDVRYAPPGIDARTFSPGGKRDLTGDSYILCVGRLDDHRKNVGLLLEAYARMPEAARAHVTLKLAGLAGPPQAFWRRADELGLRDRVEFVHRPARDELVALYRAARMFALPSDEEGLGVVLLEAMACGVPAVSTRSGGPDGIITDGVDGYLVPLDDAAALAHRMTRLATDPALNRNMGVEARLTIDRRYSDEVAGQAFVDMWDRLLLQTATDR